MLEEHLEEREEREVIEVYVGLPCPLCIEEGREKPYPVKSKRGFRAHQRRAHPDLNGDVEFGLPVDEPDDQAELLRKAVAGEEMPEEGKRYDFPLHDIEPAAAPIEGEEGKRYALPLHPEPKLVPATPDEAYPEPTPEEVWKEALTPYDETPEEVDLGLLNPREMLLVPSTPTKQSWIEVLLANTGTKEWSPDKHRLRAKWVDGAGEKIPGPQWTGPLNFEITPGGEWIHPVMVPIKPPKKFKGAMYLKIIVFEKGGREFEEDAVVILAL